MAKIATGELEEDKPEEAHSKKLINHRPAISLYFRFYHCLRAEADVAGA